MEYIEGIRPTGLYVGGRPDEMLFLARVLADAAAVLRRVQVRAEWGAGATRQPGEAATLAARARVWAEASSDEVRRRARRLTDEPRLHFDEPQFFPLAGGQHGKRRLQLSHPDAQLERARAVAMDPKATQATRDAAQKLLDTEGKNAADRRNRQSRDAKPRPSSAKARRGTAARRADQQAAKQATRDAEAAGREAADEAARKAADEAARKAADEAARKAAEYAAGAKLAEMDHGLAEGAAKAGAAVGAAAVGVWWAGKILSPTCGPAVLVCAAVL